MTDADLDMEDPFYQEALGKQADTFLNELQGTHDAGMSDLTYKLGSEEGVCRKVGGQIFTKFLVDISRIQGTKGIQYTLGLSNRIYKFWSAV